MTVQDSRIVVDLDGEPLIFVGSPERYTLRSARQSDVEAAKQAIAEPTETPVLPGRPEEMVSTGGDSLLGILAAMVSVDFGRATILEMPDSLSSGLLRK